MDHGKKLGTHSTLVNNQSVHSKQFVFFDKKTGTRRFEVKASEDGNVSLDQAVNTLAIYCVARHQMPREFNMMVMAGDELVEDLQRRALKLIQTCSGAMTRLTLSKRQYQVLTGIADDLSNKEIAARLNLSERTVKFHVSAMLEKFGVHGRSDLLLEAGDCLGPDAALESGDNPGCLPRPGNTAPALTSALARPRLMIPMERRVGR
jgi:DNA-binding CsgD family transcriptional regulator